MNQDNQSDTKLVSLAKKADGFFSSFRKKLDEIDVDDLKEKGASAAASAGRKIESYEVKKKIDTALDAAKRQVDEIEIRELGTKFVDAASKAESGVIDKAGSMKKNLADKKNRFIEAVRRLFQKTWKVAKWALIIVIAGSVIGMFLPEGNPVAKTSCYARGVAYYTAIGSFPSLSTGENAIGKIKGMCARSGGIAFGAD